MELLTNISTTELLDKSTDHQSGLSRFVGSLAEAYAYRAIEAPIQSGAQFLQQAHIIDAKTANFDEPKAPKDLWEYHGKLLGDAAAIATHFLIAQGIAKSVMPSSTQLTELSGAGPVSLRSSFLKGAALGLAYEGLVTPVSKADMDKHGFWRSRAENAGAGAIMFGTMNASAGLMRNMSVAADGAGLQKLSTVLSNAPFAGVVAGLPAGFIGAESNSLLKQGKLADSSQILESMYQMSVVGLSFGAVAELTKPRAQSATDTTTKSAEANGLAGDRKGISLDQKGQLTQHQVQSEPDFVPRRQHQNISGYDANGEFQPDDGQPVMVDSEGIDLNSGPHYLVKGINPEVMRARAIAANIEMKIAADLDGAKHIVQSEVLPAVVAAEKANAVTANLSLSTPTLKSIAGDLVSALKSRGFIADAAGGNLFLSWSPDYVANRSPLSVVLDTYGVEETLVHVPLLKSWRLGQIASSIASIPKVPDVLPAFAQPPLRGFAPQRQ